MVVVGVAAEVVVETEVAPKTRLKLPTLQPPDTRVLNTPTYPQAIGRGAGCISGGDAKVTSVQNPRPALGRIFSNLSQTSENLTSPATLHHFYKTRCIPTNHTYRKYIAFVKMISKS